MLVLAGIVVGALAGAGISLVKILADPYNQLPAITFWLLGSLSGIKSSTCRPVAPLVLLGLVPLAALRWRIGVLSLGDDEAKALGVNVRFVRGVVILAATLITATAVSVSGVIGWIGLVVSAHGPPAGRPALRPCPAGGRADGGRLPGSDRHRGAYGGAHRNPARSADGAVRRAGLRLVAGARPAHVELNVLGARGLSIGYDGRTVAAGIDLTVARGEVFCLLGPNGAGKTTLFKTLLGLLPPVAGEVTVGERALASLPRAEPREVDGLCSAGPGHGVCLHRARPRADGPHRTSRAVLGAGRGDRERARAALADLGIRAGRSPDAEGCRAASASSAWWRVRWPRTPCCW